MKKIVLLIIITILISGGCTYQNPAASTINPAAINTIVTGEIAQADGSFTLTQAGYEKLKAPLMVFAKANKDSPGLKYDLKNGLTKYDIEDYALQIAYNFDCFYPIAPRIYFGIEQNTFDLDNQKYGIKKGDVYIGNNSRVHVPQKAINSILISTFGEEALHGIDLSENIFDGTVYTFIAPKLEDGIYLFDFGKDFPEEDDLGTLDLPVKGNENTEFTTSFNVDISDNGEGAEKIENYDTTFKLKKDDTSEWGYNITAFNTTIPDIKTIMPATPTPDSTKAPIVPGSIVTPNPQATFTLTKADYEKLKAPLTVWALANESDNDSNYDLKNGLTRENVADYTWNIAYAFDYFDPSTPRFSEYYSTSIEKFGIKEGDLRQTGIKFYTPKRAINVILLSTFGKKALNEIDLNKDIFDGVKGVRGGLKDGIYTTVLYESYPEEDVLGPLDLPISGNEDTEFKTSYKVTYGDAGHEAYNYSIVFKLKKDDTSEWGYNITAFNMQEVK